MNAAPTLTWMSLTDASGAPGTDFTGGTWAMNSLPYSPDAPTKWPEEMISSDTGEEPLVKNNRPPPGAKKPCSVASSGTRSLPNVTSPKADPTGLAKDFDGQPLGPILASASSVHVTNPDGCNL